MSGGFVRCWGGRRWRGTVVFTQLGDVLVWLLVRAASESERTGRRYVSQYLPCTHSSRPSNPVTFVTLYLRHACSFAQHLFPHNAISLPSVFLHMLNCWRNILFTMAAAIWWHCWHLFVCAKKKKKKGLGFPWRMFDLGCEIKRWEYIQQRHNAEHFRTSRKKPNTTQKKNSSLKWANIWGKVECRRRGSWEWRNQNRHTKLLKKK